MALRYWHSLWVLPALSGEPPLHWSAALLCPDVLETPGPVTVRFVEGGNVLAEVASTIQLRKFSTEEIPLNRTMSELRAKPDPRKDREAQAIWAIYERFDPEFAWAGGKFLLPVSSTAPHSAGFGDTRHYLYSDGKSDQDYHRGIDFAVPVGTLVSAPAPGTVVFVEDRLLTGITVVVEHAPGLYSCYFHLSKALVRPGQKVGAHDSLAYSGATGFVTGPHLHWEIRAESVSVDPLDLVTVGLLDTDAVSAVISSSERSTH